MLVCKDWYAVTTYEKFWMQILRNHLQNELSEMNQMVNQGLGPSLTEKHFCRPRYYGALTIRKQAYLKNKKHYLNYLEKFNDIYLTQAKPMTRRKTTNDDIYGETYKEATRKFLSKRNTTHIQCQIELMLLDIQNLQHDWDSGASVKKIWLRNIIPYVESRPFGRTPKEICAIPIHNHVLLEYVLSHDRYRTNMDDIIEHLIEKCQASVCSSLPALLTRNTDYESKTFSFYRSEDFKSDNIFSHLEREVMESRGKRLPYDIMEHLSGVIYCDYYKPLVGLIKDTRRRDFKPKFLKRYLEEIFQNIPISPDRLYPEQLIERINFLLYDCGMTTLPNYKEEMVTSVITEYLINRWGHYASKMHQDDILEQLKVFRKECCLAFNSNKVVARFASYSESTVKIIQFLVEECKADLTGDNAILQVAFFNCSDGKKFKDIMYLLDCGAVLEDIDIDNDDTRYHVEANPLNAYFCPLESYVEHIRILSKRTGKSLTDLKPFIKNVRRCVGSVKSNTLIYILKTIPKEFGLDIGRDYSEPFSSLIYSWNSIAAVNEGITSRNKILRFLEGEFPKVMIC